MHVQEELLNFKRIKETFILKVEEACTLWAGPVGGLRDAERLGAVWAALPEQARVREASSEGTRRPR